MEDPAMKNVAGIVLAAGHGSVATLMNKSKLVEVVAGKPMVCRPVQILRDELKLMTLVVTNNRFESQIRNALHDHLKDCFIHQPDRTGTAGAVKECLSKLSGLAEIEHVIVLYGDMPCWKTDTIRRLVENHIKQNAVLSMLRIDLRGKFASCVENFGRILYDKKGKIIAVREPYEMAAKELKMARYVNPSAWVFNLNWLKINLPHLKPHNKGDGHSHEYWLPDLVLIAFEQKKKIASIELDDAREALGVNNLEQLGFVRQIMEG